MLNHPTLDKLHTLRLSGMARAFAEQLDASDTDALSTEERLALMVDRELLERDNRRLTTRLRKAKLRHHASVEDIDYRHPRGLDRGQAGGGIGAVSGSGGGTERHHRRLRPADGLRGRRACKDRRSRRRRRRGRSVRR